MSDVLSTIEGLVARYVQDAALSALEGLRRKTAQDGTAHLEVWLASLPRKVGRDGLAPEIVSGPDARVDLGSLRVCDLAAADLIVRATEGAADAAVERLYFQGDAEERRMILRALPFLRLGDATGRLLVEAHRTNDQIIFEAGLLDTDLGARSLDDDAYGNVVLKAAFLDLPLVRLPGCTGRATPRLSSMLLDFMSEREAAGRPAWAGTLEVCAHAPTAGVHARLLGDLWHGNDARRAAAIRGAAAVKSLDVRPWLRERRDREESPRLRALIDDVLSGS